MSFEIDTTPVQCTMLVTAQAVALARAVASYLPGGVGMLVAAVAPPGASAPTHYVNEWHVWKTFYDAFQDVDLFLAVVTHYGGTLPRAQAEYLLANATVQNLPAGEVLAALGLQAFNPDSI
jgi:hypothetical protein